MSESDYMEQLLFHIKQDKMINDEDNILHNID